MSSFDDEGGCGLSEVDDLLLKAIIEDDPLKTLREVAQGERVDYSTVVHYLKKIGKCRRTNCTEVCPGGFTVRTSAVNRLWRKIQFCDDTTRRNLTMGVAIKNHEQLHLRVNDIPTLSSALMFGFQQAMLCLSGLLVYPYLVSEAVCAGDATVQLRVQLIAATFVSCGVATIIQTTFGLRLCVLHGPAMAFLPPLLAYKALRASECPFNEYDRVSEEIWQGRLQEISGSLLVACISFFIIGGTGIAGVLAKLIGPMTIVPLMILLTTSIVPTIESKLSLHWISLVMLMCVVTMAVYMEHLCVPLPYYSFKKKRIISTKIRLFGQFPYLLSISLIWFICYLMTITDLEPVGGQARTDKNVTTMVLRESPWFQVPFPGQFGMPRWSLGLCMGYVASCVSSVIENIGSYDLLARVSQQRAPPKNAVNRAIMIEVDELSVDYYGDET
ncbi:hypothetical protein RB195_000994 [Necator americanus]|uniref:Uncharacterized protein n=1 Tax=Necator americanus TaxID=51031 RepID=A0ABR1DDI8_NECAM